MDDDKKIIMRYRALEARLALIEGRNCDSSDYLISVFCGTAAGLIDSLFVGKPNLSGSDNSIIGREIDKLTEQMVERFADINISHDSKVYDSIAAALKKERLSKSEFNRRLKEELIKHGIPENFAREKGYSGFRGEGSKLVYLENKFRVSYDQTNRSKLKENIPFKLSPNDHHIKSVAHWPDIIGLLAAIADQFTGKTTFISDGKIYRVTPDQNIPTLRGKTVPQKIFFGFVNWFGHLMSDLCGSHSAKGRGDGIPIPFFGVFMACDFGSFSYGTSDTQNGLTLSELAVRVYQQGYDARFGAALALPVLIQDLMIRFIWTLKAHFVRGRPWSRSIPTEDHKDLRMMLLVGDGALCLVDGIDAFARSGPDLMEFILHLNIAAWLRLAQMALREICVRYGFTYADMKVQYEYLGHQMSLITSRLENVDYGLYDRKITALDDISALLDCGDMDGAAQTIEDHLSDAGIASDVRDRDDFRSKLTEVGFSFKIGR